ncbi:MAG: HAMP domain-containing histidine kinase [Candidatus Thiodiazotropha sp. (ex Lucinoma borealis)]|nr:HAMP domain-containing histidine kinase [Candidatus Thiodiazotropha sp. (ex Lucinoma borealis)]
MDFSDILASIIHDMKNSLGMVINTLDELAIESGHQENSKLASLQHESKRLNNNLIALLSLYKIDNGQLDPHIEEVSVEEFLEEIVIDNQILANIKGVSLKCECESDLAGYFDEWLIRGVINNLIGNGLRYTSDRIIIYCEMIDNYLVLSIEDDGAGFPQSMIDAQSAFNNNNSLNEGHTQLGIYFASMAAHAHKNGAKHGLVKLSNNNRLKGGCFSIWLP